MCGGLLYNVTSGIVNEQFVDIATCASKMGLRQRTPVMLPYGFAMVVKPISDCSDWASNMYENYTLESLVNNCGALVLDGGTSDMSVILFKIIMIGYKQFGVKAFIRLYDYVTADLLAAMNIGNINELVEKFSTALRMEMSDHSGLMFDVLPMDEIVDFYAKIHNDGIVKTIAYKRNMFGYEYPRILL